MKWGILFWVWWNSMEPETGTWLEFANGGKAIVEEIWVSEEKNKSKRVGLQESQLGIWVRSFEI